MSVLQSRDSNQPIRQYSTSTKKIPTHEKMSGENIEKLVFWFGFD